MGVGVCLPDEVVVVVVAIVILKSWVYYTCLTVTYFHKSKSYLTIPFLCCLLLDYLCCLFSMVLGLKWTKHQHMSGMTWGLSLFSCNSSVLPSFDHTNRRFWCYEDNFQYSQILLKSFFNASIIYITSAHPWQKQFHKNFIILHVYTNSCEIG